MMRTWKVLLPFIFFLSACAPSEAAIQAAISQTMAANPTATQTLVPSNTPAPSSTPTETPTLTPTYTETATPTSTKTSTPTRTSTSTPLPPGTQTAEAQFASQTTVAQTATATRASLNSQRTSTAQAISRQATLVAQYAAIDWRELINYPHQHTGEKVKIRARVFNIVNTITMQVYLAGTYEAVYVKMKNEFSGIYENNVLWIYGTVDGTECFKNAYNAEICQPLLKDSFYEK